MSLVVVVLASIAGWLWVRRPGRRPVHDRRLLLVLLLVELRSGHSVLGALQQAAAALPEDGGLRRTARVAAVSGLTAAVSESPDSLRPVIAQLARAQASGASLEGTVRRLLETDLADERARRLNRTKSLPTRLMLPVTLLMLPGVVLLVYGPSVVSLYGDLFSVWP